MARKSKAGPSGKKGAGAKKAINKSKKDKNIFKVSEAKSKKKPKEVQGKLKKIKQIVKNKQEKSDARLKDLHKDLVVKRATTSSTTSASAIPKKPVGKAKKPNANAKKVSQKLGNLKV